MNKGFMGEKKPHLTVKHIFLNSILTSNQGNAS